MLSVIRLLVITALLTSAHSAKADKFAAGPVLTNFGKHASVQQDLKFDKNSVFKVAFDIGKQGEVGEVNRKIETLARFINMHVANGVPAKNIHLALVVHGKAGFDVLRDKLYQEKYQTSNANSPLIQALIQNQVNIYVCGQSAAYYEITNEMLAPNVKMALSAMTAHAVLQSEGYSLNPF